MSCKRHNIFNNRPWVEAKVLPGESKLNAVGTIYEGLSNTASMALGICTMDSSIGQVANHESCPVLSVSLVDTAHPELATRRISRPFSAEARARRSGTIKVLAAR